MPIIIPKGLPAYQVMANEKIFVMDSDRAGKQDIRPIEIAIVNLMPTKEVTEAQLVRLLSNSPLQINITLIKMATYTSTHASDDHMSRFYCTLEEAKKKKFDGMIVTGAPVENMPFEEVKYWKELTEIIDFAEDHVTSTIYICWGAQAALYYQYGINKKPLPEKLFGIFETKAVVENDMLLKGMNDEFNIPHSRHTTIDEDAVYKCKELKVLAVSDKAGICIAKRHNNKSFYFTGHAEYDRNTLLTEYERDLAKGEKIHAPENYFKGDDKHISWSWRSTANLLFYNWLNYYVYQITPFDINDINK
ncbi:MAG: homoserine O-succinyltransferase [Clostridia bacterium]|nr:homoserine O-succinyltransferase [Clostridia bacterium]